MQLDQAHVLITGGGSGIGRATAALLVKHGAKVAIAGRDAKRLKTAAAEIGAVPIQCDVTQEGDVKRMVATAVRELGDLDVLINNAGIGTFAHLVETDAADFRRTWETNTLGAMLAGRECAKHFTARPKGAGGNIVNVGSTAARRGFAGGSSYCASKFALSALTECWRTELRTANVRVTQVDPSEIQTEFGANAGRPPRKSVNPSKLLSEDVAHVIASLLQLDDRGFVPSAELWATNPR